MPFLRSIGETTSKEFPLDRQVTVLGNRSFCDIVLTAEHVSKTHARIIQAADGFYVEDLNSKNGTKVNGVRLTHRWRLHDRDVIEICEYRFEYCGDGHPPGAIPRILREIDAPTTVERTLADARPEEKLHAMFEICSELAGVINLDAVLERILTSLFRIFPQAERAFFLLREDRGGSIVTRASKLRDPDSEQLTISRTVFEYVTNSGRAILCEDVTTDTRFRESASVAESQARTMMCVPLWDHERLAAGIVQIDTRAAESRFRQEDLEFLVAVAGLVGTAVVNARLHEVAVLQEQMEQEEKDARAVQRSLIPEASPTLPGYEFWHAYEPALFVGGDYFDYRPVSGPGERTAPTHETRWAIALGDVAGKGMAAALLMARLSSEVRLLLQAEPDPARVVERLNRNLCAGGIAERFVTFILAILDGERNELIVVNAGHMGPMIRRAGGTIEVFGEDQGGVVLGVSDQMTYTATATPIGPGDVVVLYTDGVSEAQNADREQFGVTGLKAALAAAIPRAGAVGVAILDAVRRHAGAEDQYDDITLLCFGRT